MTTEKDEVDMADTYSQSSAEDDDHDDDDSVEDEQYNDNDDKSEPFWKQHMVAIMIAFMATCAGHWYNNNTQQKQQPYFDIGEFSTQKHAHVHLYRRTANISFCQPLEEARQQDSTSSESSSSSLKPLTFYMAQELLKPLQVFYLADDFQDDSYEQVYDSVITKTSSNDPEFQCLWDQYQRKQTMSHQKLQGTTFYYKSPTMEEIYPEASEAAAVSSGSLVSGSSGNSNNNNNKVALLKERQRKLQQAPPLVFTGFAAKFVNLSPQPVLLYWDGKGGHADADKLVGEIAPMESLGTATMPGHSFHVTPIFDSATALQRWVVTADTALVYYEPYDSSEELYDVLTKKYASDVPMLWGKYQRQMINQAYARSYLINSHRTWLAHFPRRFPMHYIHSADYIGQTHNTEDFTLRVVSVTPRVLVIDNFLSQQECQDVIDISQTQGLQHSTLYSGSTVQQTRDTSTRSSSNTWLPRDTNDLTESIYQRAAQVTNIDLELFQKFHASSPHHHSIAESLQVVRYKPGGEEYQPHHDFVYPSINHRYQPTRFATLLMYLKDVPEGGETRFPRAVNPTNANGLEVQPKAGQAVLFYNMLPDGNVDDLSLHASNPTTKHEKWLANLWIWDPIID